VGGTLPVDFLPALYDPGDCGAVHHFSEIERDLLEGITTRTQVPE
jgi:hypothetical protein